MYIVYITTQGVHPKVQQYNKHYGVVDGGRGAHGTDQRCMNVICAATMQGPESQLL